MTDAVEAVARAIAVRQKYDPDGRADEYGLAFKGFAVGDLPCWHFFKNDATAAIEALKAMDWKPPEKPNLLADVS